jgi:hypothetical protein
LQRALCAVIANNYTKFVGLGVSDIRGHNKHAGCSLRPVSMVLGYRSGWFRSKSKSQRRPLTTMHAALVLCRKDTSSCQKGSISTLAVLPFLLKSPLRAPIVWFQAFLISNMRSTSSATRSNISIFHNVHVPLACMNRNLSGRSSQFNST